MAIKNLTRTRQSRRHRKSRWNGSAVRLLFLFGWLWMVAFIGVVSWYFHQNATFRRNQPAPIHIGNADGGRHLRLHNFHPATDAPVDEITVPPTGSKRILNLLPMSQDPEAYRSPLIIFTCQRAKYLSQTLDDILENLPNDSCGFGCPIIVSEDGAHSDIAEVITIYSQKFQQKNIPILHLQHHQYRPLPKRNVRTRTKLSTTEAYSALAQHYGWALSQVFNGILDPVKFPKPDRVIILEEDIHTSPDFFTYMQATSKILDEDPTLFAVSAYNDNGQFVKDSKRLLRSDFFPGLGWTMTRKLWKEELEEKWPQSYWDDWLREPEQRKNRHVIRPEVSRTFHFGTKGGTSGNQFGSILGQVKLNDDLVDWNQQDLSYLYEPAYDQQYAQLIASSSKVKTITEALKKVEHHDVVLEYSNFKEFRKYAKQLKIMDDEKAMVPRTAYKGVVEVRPTNNHIIFLTPNFKTLRQSFPSLAI